MQNSQAALDERLAQAGSSFGGRDENGLANLYVFAQESGHIEVLAVDDRWLALFEPTPRDRLKLERLLLRFCLLRWRSWQFRFHRLCNWPSLRRFWRIGLDR